MKCWQAPADPRCLLIGRRGKLPNVPSEPTTTSILRPSLGHLLLVTMILPYSKQLLQLVLDSLDVQQLSRAESASLLVLFSAREAMMQEVPPNITLFLCAAWRRLGTRNEIPQYICSKVVARVWCQSRVSCSHQLKPSFRVNPIFGEIVSMSRPCKVSKG